MRPHNFVASPSAIGSTPLASGSSVPPWPTLLFGSPAWRRMRLTALTAVVDPKPTGLSRMIQPWSMCSAAAALGALEVADAHRFRFLGPALQRRLVVRRQSAGADVH